MSENSEKYKIFEAVNNIRHDAEDLSANFKATNEINRWLEDYTFRNKA
jgi:hypothetical protein